MPKMKTHVLVVNRNNLALLIDCITDLQRQTVPFALTVVDNSSIEDGTKAYLNNLDAQVIFNKSNVPLNTLWNQFAKQAEEPYLCFLNNDVRLPRNFVEDSQSLLKHKRKIGITCHVTNNPSYDKTGKLTYHLLSPNERQGWDFTIRKALYKPIPRTLQWFYGDDYLWHHVYKSGYEGAVLLSSPIIHYQGATSRRHIKRGDVMAYRQLGMRKDLMKKVSQSFIKPKFDVILE